MRVIRQVALTQPSELVNAARLPTIYPGVDSGQSTITRYFDHEPEKPRFESPNPANLVPCIFVLFRVPVRRIGLPLGEELTPGSSASRQNLADIRSIKKCRLQLGIGYARCNLLNEPGRATKRLACGSRPPGRPLQQPP
jgi:hypothetical protein